MNQGATDIFLVGKSFPFLWVNTNGRGQGPVVGNRRAAFQSEDSCRCASSPALVVQSPGPGLPAGVWWQLFPPFPSEDEDPAEHRALSCHLRAFAEANRKVFGPLNNQGVFLLSSFKSSSYILGDSPLSHVSFASTLSWAVACLFSETRGSGVLRFRPHSDSVCVSSTSLSVGFVVVCLVRFFLTRKFRGDLSVGLDLSSCWRQSEAVRSCHGPHRTGLVVSASPPRVRLRPRV